MFGCVYCVYWEFLGKFYEVLNFLLLPRCSNEWLMMERCMKGDCTNFFLGKGGRISSKRNHNAIWQMVHMLLPWVVPPPSNSGNEGV